MKNTQVGQEHWNYFRIGNVWSDHFVIEVCSDKKKGRFMLCDKNELVKYKRDFEEDGIKELVKFLKMVVK